MRADLSFGIGRAVAGGGAWFDPAVAPRVLERYRRHLYHYRKENGEPLSFATQQQRLLPLRALFPAYPLRPLPLCFVPTTSTPS